MNTTGATTTIESQDTFDHLVSFNLFDRNAKPIRTFEDTPVGVLIAKQYYTITKEQQRIEGRFDLGCCRVQAE